MVTWTFFVHNNKKTAKGLRMSFKNPVKVVAFFRRGESAPITFDPHDRTSSNIHLNFHLERTMPGESNIGIKIAVADDEPPHILSFSWVTDDDSGDTEDYSQGEIDQINRNYFRK
ncbi:MAG: hypothetical protein IIA82_00970 [Thaumarchaeota archaeon]|nr:hypothetical protein [Nitrososphaerota archaeon]